MNYTIIYYFFIMETTDKQRLKEALKLGDYKVYVIQRHVSQSGLQRQLDLYTIIDNQLERITYLAAEVLGWKLSRKYEAITVGGVGMDMHFHTVYTLSQILYGDGYKLQSRTI